MADDLLELPLFPLHVVLVPGMALPLHIFEPRYLEMTARCLDSGMQIGVVLACDASAEGSQDARPWARVGTMARIADYERLPNGRYNLLAIGTRRFEIVKVAHTYAYLTGHVRMLADAEESTDISGLVAQAHDGLQTYLERVLQLVGSEERQIGIPSDASDLSYVIVMCLAVEDVEKQKILEMPSVSQRLRTGMALLRAEMRALQAQDESHSHHPHTEGRANLN